MTIGGILLRARPRIVTLEQTPGVTRYTKNQPYFGKALMQFTRLGYSIRWETMRFVDYGLPQEQARITILASRYGIVLIKPLIPNLT